MHHRRTGGDARLLVCVLATSCGASAFTTKALAEPNESARRAEALFREGREAMRAHRYFEACEKFQRSDALDASPGTQLNWAFCDAELGHVAEALGKVRRALDLLPPDDDRRPIALRLIRDLSPRVAHLTVRLGAAHDETGGTPVDVRLDGAALAMAQHDGGREASLEVDPGPHVLSVEQPFRETAWVIVTATGGETVVQTVAPGPALALRAQADTPSSAHGPSGPGVRRTMGFVMSGVAAAGVLTTVVAGAFAFADRNVVDAHCPSKACDPTGFDAANRGRTWVGAGELSFGVGLACASAAVVLLWPRKSASVAVVGPLPGGLRFGIQREF